MNGLAAARTIALCTVLVTLLGLASLPGCRPSSADKTSDDKAHAANPDTPAAETNSAAHGTDGGKQPAPSATETDIASSEPTTHSSADHAADEHRADEHRADEHQAENVSTSDAPPVTAAHAVGGTERAEPLTDWPRPDLVIFITGRQHGYIEPCGCTGLANQKGGLARRYTLLKQLVEDRQWPVLPVDAGDLVRRFGRQAEIKFQISAEALRTMGYVACTLGPDDLRLSIDELTATTAQVDDIPSLFVSANMAVLDREFTPRYRVVENAGKRIAITAVLGDQARKSLEVDELISEPAEDALRQTWEAMAAENCDYHILLAQATLEETTALARAVPHFQLVVTAGGGEEASYMPETIPETDSLLIKVGAKGMYAGVLGIFTDAEHPWRFERVALDSRFGDAQEMRDLMATYQNQLERLGLEGLGLRPIRHGGNRTFVGAESCRDCHEAAYEVWENSAHHHATDSLVMPGERSDIPRHFDPECLSCHVTGWNAQRFFPYESGYLNLTETPHLVGSGCENCHGPGSAHVAAEQDGADMDMLTMLREQMRLPLAEAEKKCMECHDLDNSPDFHESGAFERYWSQVEH